MKKSLLLASFLFFISVLNAQQHKIVYDLSSADTSDQSTVLRQFNNILKEAPTAELEVVCHGQAIFMLVKDKTVLSDMMQELKDKQSVSFAACNNSMKKNNIDKSQLVGVANVVPNGVMEVVAKEEDGWSYIKAGD